MVPTRATPAPAMSCFMPCDFCSWIVVAVTFEQVDDSPYREASAEGDNEGFQGVDCACKKLHKFDVTRKIFGRFIFIRRIRNKRPQDEIT
jgi:hypothetical protein